MRPVPAATYPCSLQLQQMPLPGLGWPSGQVTSAPSGPTWKRLFLTCELFRPAPWRGRVCLACLGAVAWPRSRRACSLPSSAPPADADAEAAATARGSREGPGILAGVGRQRAAGGGWRSGKGCKCETEGGGLAAEKAPPGSAWSLGVPGSGGPPVSGLDQKLKASSGK